MRNKVKAGLLLLLPVVITGILYLSVQKPVENLYDIQIKRLESNSETNMDAPNLPDISRFTTKSVMDKTPEPTKNPDVKIRNMEKYHGFLPMHSLHEYYAELQDRIDSKVIVISNGIVDMEALYKAINDPEYLTTQNGGYLLRVPLYVEDGATLIVRGLEQSIQLEQEAGVFIASRGNVFITNTKITGWSTKQSARAMFETSETFRPFLVFWNNSKTYIASSEFSSLGYNATKAYGISITTNSVLTKKNPDLDWPTGWIVDSKFEDMYYGLYSYEAEDIAIVGNLYKDNIMNGIDPHDSSRNLIIANNEATGTKVNHGILISSEVNNSWVFNNKSHGNAGAGIMLERNSHSNIVAYNEIYNNKEGLSFYESPDNLSWGNTIKNNTKNGIRIRNSLGITLRNEKIIDNGGYGLEAYSTKPDHRTNRDLEREPHKGLTSFDIADTSFSDNSSGQIRVNDISSASFSNLNVFRIGSGFLRSDLKYKSMELYSFMTQPNTIVLVQKQGPISKD